MLLMFFGLRRLGRRINPLLMVLVTLIAFSTVRLHAQQLSPGSTSPTPDTPTTLEKNSPSVEKMESNSTPNIHPFWDRTNKMLFAGVATFRALDYASTRNMQARGREEILLPDEVVNNSAGFASLEAAGAATSVGLSYWMHRTGHHSVERWISIVHISVSGFGAVRNYCLVSKHPVKH
jgi:hypothetical protein